MKAVSRVAASGDRRSNRELAIRGRRKRRSCPYSSASLFPLPAVKAIATGIVAFIFAPLVSLSQEKIVVLTFDDAVKSHRTFVAPYLKELGFGATFFVTYRWMEDQDNFMTWEDIKEIHELGFEIGNHTWTHRDMGDPQNVHILAGELGLVNFMLQRNEVPNPVTFAYPGNKFGPEAFKVLSENGYRFARRGMQPEVAYGKRQMGPLYDPQVHHPLLIPTTADAYPVWDLGYFKSVVDRAEPGKFVVLQFHGVPDIAHPWVHSDPDKFKQFMQYLKEEEFTVIGLNQIESYLPDDYEPPEDPYIDFRFTGKMEIRSLTPEQLATRDQLEYWVDNMRRFHRFTWDEIAEATGYPSSKIERLSANFSEVIQKDRDRLTVLPYPGGRHPRIGFLEGMIDPMRGTKLSVFLPWDEFQYAILDLPEAIFCQNGLVFLGHTHVPTMWDYQLASIENRDWVISDDGTLRNSWTLPNGIEISALVTPLRDSVDMELTVKNDSDEDMEFINGQVCIMLKGAEEFDELTNENKTLTDSVAAARSEGGNRWILTQWDQLRRTWGNPRCPCLHFDPILDPCKAGETVTVKGRIWFHEGDNPPIGLKD